MQNSSYLANQILIDSTGYNGGQTRQIYQTQVMTKEYVNKIAELENKLIDIIDKYNINPKDIA